MESEDAFSDRAGLLSSDDGCRERDILSTCCKRSESAKEEKICWRLNRDHGYTAHSSDCRKLGNCSYLRGEEIIIPKTELGVTVKMFP